jgi:hypothetical protein
MTSRYGPWTYIRKKRPPEYRCVLFCCIYPNGNTVHAVGYRDGKKYVIEWTNDHPLHDDILFWMDIPDDPFGPMRAMAVAARERHDNGEVP